MVLLVPAVQARAGVAVDRVTEPKQFAYEPVVLQPEDGDDLPEHTTMELWRVVPSVLFQGLPWGATIASSEVGYVGASTPQANVIDLAGLNDAEIALHGFSVGRLLARKPDVIWLPHRDYTWERGVLLSDAEFLKQYEVIAGAAGSGIAIRRDGTRRELLEGNMRELWSELYPGVAMEDYVVRSASWSGRKHALEDRRANDSDAASSAAVMVLAFCCKVDAATVKDHSRFCVRQDAEWRLQQYAPLIDTRLGTEFVQAIYTGKWLQRVFVKKYDKRTELMYEYKFTEDGKLLALHGKLRRWGRWMAEADLFPDADGTIPIGDVKYRLKQDGRGHPGSG